MVTKCTSTNRNKYDNHESVSVHVHVPRHCSALGNVIQLIKEKTSKSTSSKEGVVTCHGDGCMWRCLVPLLVRRNVFRTKSYCIDDDDEKSGECVDEADKVNDVLKCDYAKCMILCLLGLIYSSGRDPTKESRKVIQRHVHTIKERMQGNLEEYAISRRIVFEEPLNCKVRNIVCGNHLDILLVPPSLCASLEQERIWTSALVRLENKLIRLGSLNAYIATLGGGYFLCRYLETAILLARYQRKVALALNDEHLAGQCTVNEAYNYIFAGEIDIALKLIKTVERNALVRNDELLESICKAAKQFAKRVRNAGKFVEQIGKEESGKDTICTQLKSSMLRPSTTRDNFQRIRIRQNQ